MSALLTYCSGAASFQVFVKLDVTHTVDVAAYMSVKDVKQLLERQIGIPVQQQILVYGGKPLRDDVTLHEYSVQSNATLDLMMPGCLKGGAGEKRHIWYQVVQDGRGMDRLKDFDISQTVMELTEELVRILKLNTAGDITLQLKMEGERLHPTRHVKDLGVDADHPVYVFLAPPLRIGAISPLLTATVVHGVFLLFSGHVELNYLLVGTFTRCSCVVHLLLLYG